MPSNKTPWILGISASHNGAVCLLKGDEIVVAIQEERLLGFKRMKISLNQPFLSINYCLQYAGIEPEELDAVVISSQSALDNPENCFDDHPIIQRALQTASLFTIGHHSGHAYSAYATSGYDNAAVLVIDGMGSPYRDLNQDEQAAVPGNRTDGSETVSTYDATGISLKTVEKYLAPEDGWISGPRPDSMMHFQSLGGIFTAASEQIFGSLTDAGKVMGLAPYGKPTIPVEEFFTLQDGKIVFSNTVCKRFRSKSRWPDHKQAYSDLACSAQVALEEAVLHLVKRLAENTSSSNLVYAGGVALNSVANERIVRESSFENVFFVPPAEDSGVAIGAAYYGLWQLQPINTKHLMTKDSFGAVYT
jgi:carbamoyltransferase